MRSAKILRTILGVGMGMALFTSAAQAQPEDKRTYFTFSGPIALPGVTLVPAMVIAIQKAQSAGITYNRQ